MVVEEEEEKEEALGESQYDKNVVLETEAGVLP